MSKYKVTYTNRAGKEIATTRSAENAQGAIEKLAGQYNWDISRWGLIDANTRGLDWAEAWADTLEGVTSGFIRVFAERV